MSLSDGPYGILPPSDYWKLDVGLSVRTPFNPEAGSIGVPPAESMRLFMTEGEWSTRGGVAWCSMARLCG